MPRKVSLFVQSTDKYNNMHIDLLKKPDTHKEHVLIMQTIADAQVQKRQGNVLSVFVNISCKLGLMFGDLMRFMPASFPINPIRDEQQDKIRFIDAPDSVPTGGNADVGAKAAVWDPVNDKMIIVVSAHDNYYQFPGGRVDRNDDSIVHAAVRECKEECGFEIDLDTMNPRLLGVQFFPKNQFAMGVTFVYAFTAPNASERVSLRADGTEVSCAQWMHCTYLDGIVPSLPGSERQTVWTQIINE